MKNEPKIYDLIVIGGGPSGMMVAGKAGELGASVLLLEKNEKLGQKLKITGGGRCNITNAEFDVRKFLDNFPQSKEFLFSPFSKFSAKDTFDFFEKRGLPLVTEARKRVFPASQKASDVFDVMEKFMKKNNVKVKTNTQVVQIKKSSFAEGYGGQSKITSVKTKDGEEFFAHNFAIATGGVAAPETGSTGDGFRFLKILGHTIDKSNPNLVPMTTDAKWVHSLSGISLSFMTIKFIQNGKTKIKKTGKILFTHFGISGPLILNSAFEVKQLLKDGEVTASIDLFPDTEEKDVDRKLINLFAKNTNKKVKNTLPEMLPEALAKAILELPEISLSEKEAGSITKEERKRLAYKIKNLTFQITGTLGFEKSIVADGGVTPEETNFKNMTSKLFPNLYLLGDVININRPSGGFSLQLCWTMGYVAGSDVGEKIKDLK